MSESLAEIRDLCHPDAMELDALPVPLLEDLHALAAMSSIVHADGCSVHDPDLPDGYGCTCGSPRVLRQLAEALPLPEGARAPYGPAWVPSARAA